MMQNIELLLNQVPKLLYLVGMGVGGAAEALGKISEALKKVSETGRDISISELSEANGTVADMERAFRDRL